MIFIHRIIIAVSAYFLGLLRFAKFRLRLIQCNDKTFILATMDVQTSVTTQRCLDGTPKGAASFRWF